MKKTFNKTDKKDFAVQRTADLLAQVKAGVQAVRSSADWKAWLEVSSKFYSYSVRNTWLIAMQAPGASAVKGFQAWKSLGRTVKKGEHGIAILAPIFRKAKGEDAGGAGGGEATSERKLCFFKTVFVFDLKQTEGPELPNPAHILQGSEPELLAQVRAKAEGFGFTVTEKPLAEDLGGYVDTSKTITLNSTMPTSHRAKTLVHELAHGLLGHPGTNDLPRERKELEAETAAWIVCKQLGLETDEYSFGYLATWSAASKDFAAQLEAASENAMKAARLILAAFQEEEAQAA